MKKLFLVIAVVFFSACNTENKSLNNQSSSSSGTSFDFSGCSPRSSSVPCSRELENDLTFLCNQLGQCSYSTEENGWAGWNSENCNYYTELLAEECTYYVEDRIFGCGAEACGSSTNVKQG